MNHIQYDEDKIIMKLNKEKKPVSAIQPAINASSKRNASMKKHGFDDFYESHSEENQRRKRKTGGEKGKFNYNDLYIKQGNFSVM